MGFPRQEYWVGCHCLLQGIFPVEEAFWPVHFREGFFLQVCSGVECKVLAVAHVAVWPSHTRLCPASTEVGACVPARVTAQRQRFAPLCEGARVHPAGVLAAPFPDLCYHHRCCSARLCRRVFGTRPQKGARCARCVSICRALPQACSVDMRLVPTPQEQGLLDAHHFEKHDLTLKFHGHFVFKEVVHPFSYLSRIHFVNMRFKSILRWVVFFFSYSRDSLYTLDFFLSCRLEMFFSQCVTCLWTLLIACLFSPQMKVYFFVDKFIYIP